MPSNHHVGRLGLGPTPPMVHEALHELAPTQLLPPSLLVHSIQPQGLLAGPSTSQVRLTPALGHFCGWSPSQVPSSFTSFFHVFAARSPSQGGLPPSLFCTPIALTCSTSIHILITVYSYNWLICCVLSIVIPKSPEQCLLLK